MAEFLVTETSPVWVTWQRIVEASDEIEALRAFNEGEGREYSGPEIGDIVDGYDINQRVELLDGQHRAPVDEQV